MLEFRAGRLLGNITTAYCWHSSNTCKNGSFLVPELIPGEEQNVRHEIFVLYCTTWVIPKWDNRILPVPYIFAGTAILLFICHQSFITASFPTNQTIDSMPPARRKAVTVTENYGWVTGSKKGIAHVSLVARGGFGEVHQVFIILGTALIHFKLRDENTGEV